MDNQALIEGLRKNDKTTISFIFIKLGPMVEDLVRKNGGGNRQEAEDIFMNALEVICIKVADEHFKLTCAFSTLFYEICRRQWLKRLKQKKRDSRVTIDLENELITEYNLFSAMEQAEKYQLYREKFGLLTEGCRQILLLWLDGVPMKKIAETLGFASEEYARKRKFNCKKKLIELIQKDERFNELN